MEITSFILGVSAVAAIVVVVVTFMNNKQIKELNKQIENEMVSNPFHFVELCYPARKGCFDHLPIWGKFEIK